MQGETVKYERRKSTPSGRFEPVIPATTRFETFALDRTAIGIGNKCYLDWSNQVGSDGDIM
jgi:hypothetical protein